LFENGKGREAYSLLNRTEQPGWGHMIAKGYKTIWEGFQDIESHSHAWNAYPARIFAEYLVGIKATVPGFKEIDIRPYIPSGMLYAEARVPTIWGYVYVRWDVEGNDVILKIRIPAGVVALVFLPVPDGDPKIISEMGEYVYKVIRVVQ
jgi:alpha-L-rhamnosidase